MAAFMLALYNSRNFLKKDRLMKLLSRIFDIFLMSTLELSEGVHAIAGLMLFGLWLISPFWGALDSPLYKAATEYISAKLLGMMFLITGFIQLIAIIQKNSGLRSTCAFISCCLWGLVFTHLLFLEPRAISLSLILYMLILNGFIYIRFMLEK